MNNPKQKAKVFLRHNPAPDWATHILVNHVTGIICFIGVHGILKLDPTAEMFSIKDINIKPNFILDGDGQPVAISEQSDNLQLEDIHGSLTADSEPVDPDDFDTWYLNGPDKGMEVINKTHPHYLAAKAAWNASRLGLMSPEADELNRLCTDYGVYLRSDEATNFLNIDKDNEWCEKITAAAMRLYHTGYDELIELLESEK